MKAGKVKKLKSQLKELQDRYQQRSIEALMISIENDSLKVENAKLNNIVKQHSVLN